MAVNERSVGPWARRPDVRIGAVLAVAVAVAFVVWLVVSATTRTARPPSRRR